ncbi:MAG: Phosphate regulon transcriptional regulatory protein PhoB (SphR) [uncultured Cytophagales bacterium]|uniref:Phosphate regulon transcriptional regulatory protein PhoB n=1 Tax=uncultured Cytophagales bacterium TaxID=158755 RepID=A0A6J4IHK8_9SPHI|nr:MAG: Phosphate regulon transcriptional regulatory protein PhoB (SphR) [uncultured Cytophagales bacterium]
MKKILMVEDDENVIGLVKIHLADLPGEVLAVRRGAEGFSKALQQPFDLVILDIMLPDMDGLEVCKRLRMEGLTTPIMMLTAKSEELDKVIGLELGADDYLTKPFGVRELTARVKALLRRGDMLRAKPPALPVEPITFRELHLDPQKRRVTLGEERVELTPREFDLLLLLAANPGRSYSRKELLDRVWGTGFEGYEHTITTHINRLRTKIEPDFNHPVYILTTWGIGYRFAE